jgi:hypothetical protein
MSDTYHRQPRESARAQRLVNAAQAADDAQADAPEIRARAQYLWDREQDWFPPVVSAEVRQLEPVLRWNEPMRAAYEAQVGPLREAARMREIDARRARNAARATDLRAQASGMRNMQRRANLLAEADRLDGGNHD